MLQVAVSRLGARLGYDSVGLQAATIRSRLRRATAGIARVVGTCVSTCALAWAGVTAGLGILRGASGVRLPVGMLNSPSPRASAIVRPPGVRPARSARPRFVRAPGAHSLRVAFDLIVVMAAERPVRRVHERR